MASIEKPGPLQWHPFSGCTQLDNDCKGCWARKPAVMDRAELALPQSWSYRHFVHVGNYSDIFLESFSDKSVLEVFATMNNTPLSEFMVQTKNSERLLRLSKKISWTENIWMGVSVTNKHTLSRIDHLRDTGARIKWVGFTPLKKQFKALDLTGMNWVVVGPALYSHTQSVYDQRKVVILDECKRLGIPYYDRSRYETRKFDDYSDSTKFPKDLESLGLLASQKISCALVYCGPKARSIRRVLFKGNVNHILPEMKRFIESDPSLIILGVSPESNLNQLMQMSLNLEAESRKISLSVVVSELMKHFEKCGYDPKKQLAYILSIENPSDQFNEFGKFLLAMRYCYERFVGTF